MAEGNDRTQTDYSRLKRSAPEYERSPTRDTRAASSPKRRTWYGMGQLTRVEKSGIGRFLHDLPYAFADVSISSLPVLVYVWLTYPGAELELTAPALVAWATMVVTATLVRGGWIAPLASETPGWVSLRPSLLLLRLMYFNASLALAVYGSLGLAVVVGFPSLAIGLAFLVGASATLAFPRTADEWYDRVVIL